MASVSRPSPKRSERRTDPLAVYLLPAVVGGGRGDIEDLRAVGSLLERTGVPQFVPDGPGLPSGFAPERRRWTFARRDTTLRRRARRALIVVPQFGVCAAPALPGPYGRAGPWAPVVAALERAYGADRVVIVSLEEFARNLSAREQEFERLREGGVAVRTIRALQRTARGRRDVARMRRLWRRYHHLGRPNVLHLVPTFGARRGARRDFPELVECGPMPPPPTPTRSRPTGRADPGRPAVWVWYASPSTSPTLRPGIAEGRRRAGRCLRVEVRSPRPFPTPEPSDGLTVVVVGSEDRRRWERRFRRADLRIVTGSRSLLEALDLGAPFLYFHGATGIGRRRRTHRPEKIRSLLDRWRSAGVDAGLRRDLADFARGRRVAAIVERALRDPRWAARFPRRPIPPALPAARRDGGAFLRSIAAAWAESSGPAGSFVRSVRRGPLGRAGPPLSGVPRYRPSDARRVGPGAAGAALPRAGAEGPPRRERTH